MSRILVRGAACFFAAAILCLTSAQPARADDAAEIEALTSLLSAAHKQHDVPALAAGIFHLGQAPRTAVTGVRKREAEALATADDQWHLGSNTKPITALLLALLIDLGLLDWDTPLHEIFPEQAEKWNDGLKKISLSHLLTHTSGLPGNPPLGWLGFGPKGDPRRDRERLIKNLGAIKVHAEPGEKYVYSNLGYVVLGAVIDVRGEASWEEQVSTRIFKPLGIKHWSLGPLAKKDAIEQPWPHHADGKAVVFGNVMDNPPVMNSAGRVSMSVADYGRLLTEMLKLARGDKGLLKAATAQKLFTNPHPTSPHSLSGWVGYRKQAGAKGLVLEHDGSNTFNYCTAAIIPDRSVALCVMTNQGGDKGQMVCHEVRKGTYQPRKR